MAKNLDFFRTLGNDERANVVLDEDPIQLLRPLVSISRTDLVAYITLLDDDIIPEYREKEDHATLQEARQSLRVAQWCWQQIGRQGPDGAPEAVPIPADLKPTKAVLRQTKRNRAAGRQELTKALHRRMRNAPDAMVRNVYRDLRYLVNFAAGKTCFATHKELVFHLKVDVPGDKRVFILDATGNPELLRPLFAPRPVEVHCDVQVQPAGRVIQFMDCNGPRAYLNKAPAKLGRILDAVGDLHPRGQIVLITHKSAVDAIAKSTKHANRIIKAWFGALRGRNDLESTAANPIACHVVCGSPKTTEDDRRQLALAVYGRSILPFPPLEKQRLPVKGLVPRELSTATGDHEQWRAWKVLVRGYDDPRMQAVYEHTVTAELTQASDRARVLIHEDAVVYLVTNEPVPKLWFAEKCFAGDLLDLTAERKPRSDFEAAYEGYEEKARELLDGGGTIGNADVCRALKRKPTWGHRYWAELQKRLADSLEGERKLRWKEE